MPIPPKRTGPPKRLVPDEELPANSEFVSAGYEVRCLHCEGTKFEERRLPVDGRSANDFLPPRTVALICQTCSHIEWFAEPPEMRAAR